MEVANFHSALTHTAQSTESQWLTSGASKNFTLALPDGTSLSFDVKVKDSSGLKSIDLIQITIWMNHKLIEDERRASNGGSSFNKPLAKFLNPDHFPITIQCQPPLPKYKTVEEEPDDNSPAMRASRCATAQIDTSKYSEGNMSSEQITATVWVQLYVMMSLLPSEEAINVYFEHQEGGLDIGALLQASGLGVRHPIKDNQTSSTSRVILCPRAAFWQSNYPFSQSPWLLNQNTKGNTLTSACLPTSYIVTANVKHPQRPAKYMPAKRPLYTRYIMELGETLTFEVASSKDAAFVKQFSAWQNSDRVSAGWRQKGSEEEHRQYLESVEKSASSIGLVGKWDGQPWGYMEIYWVKESNVGPYYDAQDYDRGFHALVGEENFRGPHRVRSWMGSLIHMLFLLDPRTERVLLEPRASNYKMINYAQMCGGHVEKLIDLSHKRAALVVIPREGFFQLCPLGPLPA
ncbi:hypothetical protein CBS101457_000610 [Exobasidium rhododendri]|nr:hypothetical protein CBS101457_000610 [Exobasidium rhododendri]